MASKARIQRDKDRAAEKAAENDKEASSSSGGTKKRAQRATSNVFSLFSQSQIQEFKEAFTMIDQNRDGFIDTQDLADMYASLGREPSKKDLEEMLKEAPGQLNFTAFLTLFGEKLHGTDPERTIQDAFKMFDEEGKNYLEEEYFKDLLMNMGDNYNQSEINQVWKELPMEGGKIDYTKFVKIIKGSNLEDLAM